MPDRPNIPFAKGRKFCVFCGAPADSEEHIMPRWAKHLFPPSSHHERWVLTGRHSTGVRVQKRYERQGSVHTLRIKRVCRPCNSGWMGTFEEDVRPFLERMISGDRTFVSEGAQAKLAQYLSYKMLVLDWLDWDSILPPQFGHDFYDNKCVPGGTSIWIFNCFEGRWQGAVRTEAVGLSLVENWHPGLAKNTKSFAVGFGYLFVFAVMSAETDLNVEFDAPSGVRLWPPLGKHIVWPPRYPIDSGQAEYIASILQRVGDAPNVIDFGG